MHVSYIWHPRLNHSHYVVFLMYPLQRHMCMTMWFSLKSFFVFSWVKIPLSQALWKIQIKQTIEKADSKSGLTNSLISAIIGTWEKFCCMIRSSLDYLPDLMMSMCQIASTVKEQFNAKKLRLKARISVICFCMKIWFCSSKIPFELSETRFLFGQKYSNSYYKYVLVLWLSRMQCRIHHQITQFI